MNDFKRKTEEAKKDSKKLEKESEKVESKDSKKSEKKESEKKVESKDSKKLEKKDSEKESDLNKLLDKLVEEELTKTRDTWSDHKYVIVCKHHGVRAHRKVARKSYKYICGEKTEEGKCKEKVYAENNPSYIPIEKKQKTKGARLYYPLYWAGENYRDYKNEDHMYCGIKDYDYDEQPGYENESFYFYDIRINDEKELGRMYDIYKKDDSQETFSPKSLIPTTKRSDFINKSKGKSINQICGMFNLSERYYYNEGTCDLDRVEDNRKVHRLIVGT